MAETPVKEGIETPSTSRTLSQTFAPRLGVVETNSTERDRNGFGAGEAVAPRASPPDAGFAWVFLVAAFLAE